MELNDIKKALYKEYPDAILINIDSSGPNYEASLKDGTVIYFSVPFSDIGNTNFYAEMDAKLLIKWIKL